MNFYYLKYFYDTARLGSMTKAAKLNHIGQPAISKGIQNLESSLCKTLVAHKRNRFQLTEDGERAFNYCQKIFSATEELRDALSKKPHPSGEVRVACPSSMAETTFLTAAISRISEKYPHIALKLMLGRTDLVGSWVRDGIADFGICLNNVDMTEFKTHTLKRGFHFLMKSPSYKGDWHQDGILSIENKREVLLLRERYQSEFKRRLKTKMEIGSWNVIKRFVLSGLAVGFVPDYLIQVELKSKSLKVVEGKKLSIPYEIQLITQPERYLPRRCDVVISEFTLRVEC